MEEAEQKIRFYIAKLFRIFFPNNFFMVSIIIKGIGHVKLKNLNVKILDY